LEREPLRPAVADDVLELSDPLLDRAPEVVIAIPAADQLDRARGHESIPAPAESDDEDGIDRHARRERQRKRTSRNARRAAEHGCGQEADLAGETVALNGHDVAVAD